jgi:mannosyl-glycoprotein endo-beta-N-acetylglucosaminidase
MRDMLEYFHAHSNLLITWYDAMTQTGAVNWQNALTAQNQMFFQDGDTLVSDEMFLNFNWNATRLNSSSTLATSLGRSPYDLYAGIDVESNGYNTSVLWNAVFPEGAPHVTSIGFYRPEWTHNSASTVADFYARDNRFWIGPNGDPSNTTSSSNWKGVAHYIPANSPITTLPFVTNFNTGQGAQYFVDGVAESSEPWNNLSLQDVLPTWRWIMRSSGALLDVGLTFDDAWWGGSSIAVSGTTDSPNELLLYETNLPADDFLSLVLVYRLQGAGPSYAEVGVAYDDDPATFVYSPVEDAEIPFWVHAVIPLGSRPGRSVVAIKLRFSPPAGTPYSMKIGRLGVYSTSAMPEPPGDLHIVSFDMIDTSHATLRLAWTPAAGDVNSYAVFQHHSDDSETWLGGTPNTAYFVQQVARVGDEPTSTVEVKTINSMLQRSTPATVTVVWEESIFANGFDP